MQTDYYYLYVYNKEKKCYNNLNINKTFKNQYVYNRDGKSDH